MSEIWDKPITDNTDWGGDSSTNGLPVSGRQVQAWLKSRIAKILTEQQVTKIVEDWAKENGFVDDKGFVTLSSDQEVNGLKNFLQGLMVNGGLVTYDPTHKAWQLNGDLLVTGGISMFSSIEGYKPSTIMDAIVTDGVTIKVNDAGQLSVVKAGLDYEELDAYLRKNGYSTTFDIDGRIRALVDDAPAEYDTLGKIATILEREIKNIEGKADKTYVDDNFISRTKDEDVAAILNFLNGFSISGIPFRKTKDGKLFIDSSAVFSGGITMYGTDTTPAPSIFDGLPIDNETIYWDNGVLKAMGGGGGGGVADSVAWANVTGKPKWLQDAGNAKPTYNYSDILNTPDLSVYALASSLANYALKTSIPTNNNQLTNGAGYITAEDTVANANKLDGYLPTTYMRASGQYTDSLNDLTSLGIYRMADIITDGPAGAEGYGNLMVIRSNSWDTLSQLYFNANNRRIFVRSGTNSNLPSKSWDTIAFTSDIPSLTGYATETFVNTALARYLPLSGGTVNGVLSVESVLRMSDLDGTYKILLQRDTSGNILFGGGFATNNMYIDADVLRIRANNTIFRTANIGTLQIITNEINGANGTGNAHINYSSTGKVTIANGGGNVAIGGTTADEKLHVHGNVKATGTFTTTDYIRTSKYIETGYLHLTSGIDDSFRTSVFGDAAGWGRMKALRTGGYETGSYGVLPGNYTTAMAFAMSDTHAFIAIPSVASKASEVVVGGGNADKLNWSATLLHSLNYSDYALPITGGTIKGNLLTEGGITMYSQRSLKNILSYDGLSLEQLSVIKPIKFTWKDGRDNRYHVGGVADDVATVVPEVVYSANDLLTMDYGNAGFYVAASLIKPVVDHEQRIKQLEQENTALRDEINQLKQAA